MDWDQLLREIDGLQDLRNIDPLIDLALEMAREKRAALAQYWEQQCSLEQHVAKVASAFIDVTQMEKIDPNHKETTAMRQHEMKLSEGLLVRLDGDKERFNALVTAAAEQELQKRAQEPADTLRAAHRVIPKRYSFSHEGVTYNLVPDYRPGQVGGAFRGTYYVLVDGQKVGRMDYYSDDYWKVPNHTCKKDLKKAIADFLHWQQNPRRQKPD
jgi:hypothetical protein